MTIFRPKITDADENYQIFLIAYGHIVSKAINQLQSYSVLKYNKRKN